MPAIKNNLAHGLRRLAHMFNLSAPSTPRTNRLEHQPHTRLLGRVLALFGGSGLACTLIFPLVAGYGWQPWEYHLFFYNLSCALSTGVCYLLLHRGHLHLASLGLLGNAGASVVAFLAVWYGEWPHMQILAVFPLLLASVFLGGRTLIAYVLLYHLALLPVLLLAPSSSMYNDFGGAGLLLIALLLLLARQHHDRLAEQRAAALATSEARLRTVTGTISEIIVQIDDARTICYLSPAFERLTGWGSARLLGQPLRELSELCHPDDRERVRRTIVHALSGKLPDLFNYRLLRHDGSELWLETAVSVGVGPTPATLSIRDISDRKQAEAMRRHDRLKDEFLSIVAHELRGPLGIIYAYAELIADGHAPPDRRDRFASQLMHQSRHLSRIVEDLLDIERMKAQGRLALQLEPIALAALAAEEFVAFSEAFPSHRFALLDNGCQEPLRADRGRVSQVVRNLLSNAVKYSPPGSLIQIVVRSEAGRAELAVCDQGHGLSAEQQDRLFEPFYRADAPRNVHGAGLGLTIARAIAVLHGGDLTVESSIGKGSRFSLWLPLAPASSAE